MPLQQDESEQARERYKKSINFDLSRNENSVIEENPNSQNPNRYQQNPNENDIQEVGNVQDMNIRHSFNRNFQSESMLKNSKFADTNMMYSNNNGTTTVTTPVNHTVARNNYQDSNEAMVQNYPEIIEEEKSFGSQYAQEDLNFQNKMIPSPYHEESIRKSNSHQQMNTNNIPSKTVQRYSQPNYGGIKNNVSQEDYELINNAVNPIQRDTFTRNKGHFQKSSEFTFVGRKMNHSPNDNMLQRKNRAEAVCSSRQSMIMNPLTDVNVTSTTKKQHVQKSFNDPRRMTNIEEEQVDHTTSQENFEESQQLMQYFETDTFNQANFNQHNAQGYEDNQEYEDEDFQVQTLLQKYNDMNEILEIFTRENQVMRDLLGDLEQNITLISQN